MSFSQNIQIYFDDCDPGGIVFYGNYFRITHRVFEDYVRFLGLKWEDWFKNPKWAVPLRKAQSEYLQPLFAGQSYVVEISVMQVGESSVTFEYRILNAEKALCARLETTHVFIDIKKMRKIKIPPTIRQKLKVKPVKTTTAKQAESKN